MERQNTRVPVVNPDGTPAMPTKASRARRWMEQGKAAARWNDLGQFYVQLVEEPSGYDTQDVVVGVDPGKLYSGIATQSAKVTLFTAHLQLPYKIVKERMEFRKLMRRARRGRRINRQIPFHLRAHRQKRFDNRRQAKVAPSIRANRQLELRVVSELCKVFPVSKIVYEYVKARTNRGCSFSPVMVGQKFAIKQLSKLAPVSTLFGWETSQIREHLGLEKQRHHKGEAIPQTHAVDGIALAASEFVQYEPFNADNRRGHQWTGSVKVTAALFKVIRRPPYSRRQLHLANPSKGGKRRAYGGTTTPYGIRKGDLVRYKGELGYCSGSTARQISISNADWKRLGQRAASKVELVARATRLLVSGVSNPVNQRSYPSPA